MHHIPRGNTRELKSEGTQTQENIVVNGELRVENWADQLERSVARTP